MLLYQELEFSFCISYLLIVGDPREVWNSQGEVATSYLAPIWAVNTAKKPVLVNPSIMVLLQCHSVRGFGYPMSYQVVIGRKMKNMPPVQYNFSFFEYSATYNPSGPVFFCVFGWIGMYRRASIARKKLLYDTQYNLNGVLVALSFRIFLLSSKFFLWSSSIFSLRLL